MIEGLDRWLAQITARLEAIGPAGPEQRFRLAGAVVQETGRHHAGLARNLLVALARAQHDDRVRDLLTAGFHRTRGTLADLLGLGADDAGGDAAGLVLALFHALLDPALAIEGDRMVGAQARLRRVLPQG